MSNINYPYNFSNNIDLSSLFNSRNEQTQPSLADRNIIVERHIIPADLYRQWYIAGTTESPTNNINNQTELNVPSHIHRRAERINHNLSQTLSDILYGRTPTTQPSNIPTTQPSNIPTTQPSNIPTTATTNTIFNNMRFIIRDSNGNQFDYNIPMNNENMGEFSDLFTQMMDPNIPLTNIFGRNQTPLSLTQEQITLGSSIRIYSNVNNSNNSSINGISIDYSSSDTESSNNSETNNDENYNNDVESCSICREEYTNGQELRRINNCSHEFHKSCIDTWFNTNITCPICRGNII
jgi:hypothetical protein